MRALVQRLKRLWNTPVEFYGVDRSEPQAGPWHGLMLFVVLLMVLGLLWLIRYLPERTYLVQLPSMSSHGHPAAESSDPSVQNFAFTPGKLIYSNALEHHSVPIPARAPFPLHLLGRHLSTRQRATVRPMHTGQAGLRHVLRLDERGQGFQRRQDALFLGGLKGIIHLPLCDFDHFALPRREIAIQDAPVFGPVTGSLR